MRPVQVSVTAPDAASRTDVDPSAKIPRDPDAKIGQRLYLTILLEKEREYQELVQRRLEAAR